METACGYLDDKVMWVSTDERRMITHLLKLAEKHPDEVKVVARPEENDGCLYLKCPASYLKINPPARKNLSDEQRVALRERMKSMRKPNEVDSN
jgi:hypothetical protein